MSRDPIAKFLRWYAAARRSRAPLPEAMALATADRRGRPSVRYVLLKGADERGFVFFTDTRSRKGREIAENPYAALALYWDAISKQVRVEGRLVPVSLEEADAYWRTRPRGSRLAASLSTQSATMPSHRWLLARWRALHRRLGRGPVPRPSGWSGYRLLPDAIEFWERGRFRLHLRERWERGRHGWRRRFLQP